MRPNQSVDTRAGRSIGRAARGLLIALICAAAAACAPTPPEQPVYNGPTLPIHDVVDHINQNSARIPTLWAIVKYFEGNFIDDQHHSQFINGDGSLLYRSSGEFLFTGLKSGNRIFQIASGTDRYWLKIYPDPTSTIWWGQTANIGKPGVQELPIRPDLIRDVLGLSAVGPDLLSSPVPVMRFNPDARAYMFVWSVQRGDHWMPQQEIWYDMTTFRPIRVLLFDSGGLGRVVLKADLSDPIPVEVPNQLKPQWPEIAGTYRLFFPDSGTTLMFQLDHAALSHREPSVPVSFPPAPNDRSFRFLIEPEFHKVIQLDANVSPS